jgi:hypothetical protein
MDSTLPTDLMADAPRRERVRPPILSKENVMLEFKSRHLHRVLACVVVLGSTGGTAFAQSLVQQPSMSSQSRTKSAQGPRLRKADTMLRDGGAWGGISNPASPERDNPYAPDPSRPR